MKHNLRVLLTLTIIMQTMKGTAQQASKDSIEGIWKGTSLCQVKPSPCHDENVVYRISKAANGKIYSIQANKIVNGVEEDMGTLAGSYDEAQHILTVTIKDRQDRTNVWLFKVEGKKMHGTLTIDEKTLYRIIEVKKAD
jgi:hypothetical protein